MKRLEIEVQGQVQGVGFRPHVYHIAMKLGLSGHVYNNASGVQIEIQGSATNQFIQYLQTTLPTLAHIDCIHQKNIPLKTNETKFTIQKSKSGNVITKISPDASICKNCLTELFNPDNHYYQYPFINCMHCGPRYTITKQLPYDRNNTSMAPFKMCTHCEAAYINPLDRRYHTQSIACQNCGPQLSHKIEKIAQAVLSGKIIALKGLGGYQLICDANNSGSIKKLRTIKNRSNKPFALMMLNTTSIKQIAHCSAQHEKLLISKERPIVLLEKKKNNLPDSISPHLNSLGIMLPYTPIHYLLFNKLLNTPDGTDWLNLPNKIILVVTSANANGSPIIIDNYQAQKKLPPTINLIVSYNRDIVTHTDDSVINLIDNKPFFIRRARGYTPKAIALPYAIPNTIALGAYLKNTICITRGQEAFISQHIGDLKNRETLKCYRDTIKHLLKILNVKPECAAHDLHPDFYSTQIANEFNLPTFPIQHHHAHLAACAVEHNLKDQAIGLALDGFGLGDNSDSWGGELILHKTSSFKRLGSLKPIMQPGGDIAAHQPWRMAASILFELGHSHEISKRFIKQSQAKSIVQLLEKKLSSPLTSSCGRLFDAASALLGICEVSNYEGQAAMMLESKVSQPSILSKGWHIDSNQLNMLPLFQALLNCDAISGANLFHGTLATALVEWINKNAQAQNLTTILLSGGCFLNKTLSELIINKLKDIQLLPLLPKQSPVNDGGISLGQAWIAANKLMEK